MPLLDESILDEEGFETESLATSEQLCSFIDELFSRRNPPLEVYILVSEDFPQKYNVAYRTDKT